MIVVFVVDTSPSMGKLVEVGQGASAAVCGSMTRLDLAKMAVEDLTRGLKKRCQEQGRLLQEMSVSSQRSLFQMGLGMPTAGGNLMRTTTATSTDADTFLLLSTSRQHPDTNACAAGGRLLVGFGDVSGGAASPDSSLPAAGTSSSPPLDPLSSVALSAQQLQQQHQHTDSFHRELKGLRATKWDAQAEPFPTEDGGGAVGLNAALSTGLQLLSRYRLQHRLTENFGMGRLPSNAVVTMNGAPAQVALQPACLVLVTDGACLRQPAKVGGGSLRLQYSSQPLKEFYQEPFRWDQRIFCLTVGGNESVSITQYLHPQLRALCEVTGGSHWMIRNANSLQQVTSSLLQHMSPPLPAVLPYQPTESSLEACVHPPIGSCYIDGGPVCCFQALEVEEGSGRAPPKRRAMLLYTSSSATVMTTTSQGETTSTLSPPLWMIPEAYFSSKKLDTLPPRPAQPLLFFSKHPASLGIKSFDPNSVIKMLQRLDQMTTANRKSMGQQMACCCLHRDVYICDWLVAEGDKSANVTVSQRNEYFPVFVPGASYPLAEDTENYLNIGILHVPSNSQSLATVPAVGKQNRLATLTLLPPEPHILLPLLIRAAEAESRMLKKTESKAGGSIAAVQKLMVPLDEHWRSEFRAYLFRIPPYYQHALKRCLRNVLPASAHSLLHTEGTTIEALSLQCFSKTCLQKIRNGEQVSRDTNERFERQEAELRRKGDWQKSQSEEKRPGYGQFDPRSSVESYKAALRNMPAPWRTHGPGAQDGKSSDAASIASGENQTRSPKSVMDTLGDLPAHCLMAYYESRRRWIFGGTGLATRGLLVEGVDNDGTNSQRGRPGRQEECPLSIAGVGVSTLNQTSTAKMGEYRERLMFSRSPIVGYGSTSAAGVSATTAADGSHKWSVDDDALPITFFDPKTGEFADSSLARAKSRFMVNFGNPYKEKRGDALVPEKFLSQSPSRNADFDEGASLGSPPHDPFAESVEEDEAIFARTSPRREEFLDDVLEDEPPRKRLRTEPPSVSVEKPATSSSPAPPTASVPAPPKPPPSAPSTGPARPPPPPPTKARPSIKAPPPPRRPSVRPPPPKANAPKPPPPKPSSQMSAVAAGKTSESSSPSVPSPEKQSVSASASPVTGGSRPPPPRPPAPGEKRMSVQLPTQTPDSGNLSLDDDSETSKGSRAPPSRPPGPPEKRKSVRAPPPQQSQASTGLDLQTPGVKPDVDLPPGWMSVWSKSQKRWYFFDTKTNRSVWQWPPPP